MYRGFKVVFFIPAGRRRYMKLLMPHLFKCDFVDDIIVLKNTSNIDDIQYIDTLPQYSSKVSIYETGTGSNTCLKSIVDFYKNLTETNTIYIKFDDDLVWIEKNAIEKILDARIQYKEFFLIYPMIINNAYCLWRLAQHGKCNVSDAAKEKHGYVDISDDFLFKDGKTGKRLHEWFTTKYLREGKIYELYIENEIIHNSRVSINCICWFGQDMENAVNYMYFIDDEEYLSRIYPNIICKDNLLVGNAFVSHFAFGPQRNDICDENEILSYYE